MSCTRGQVYITESASGLQRSQQLQPLLTMGSPSYELFVIPGVHLVAGRNRAEEASFECHETKRRFTLSIADIAAPCRKSWWAQSKDDW